MNQATDYGFRVMLYLATLPPGTVVSGQMLASSQSIPERFILKIMHSLVKAGMIRSHRGANGGFSLARPAGEITLLEVITALEGPIALHRCLGERTACNRHCTEECPVHKALALIQDQMVAGLRALNFAALAEQCRKK